MITLSSPSKTLMSSFLEKRTILHKESIPKKTQSILKNLFQELKTADKYISELQTKPDFYRVNFDKITAVSQIPMPKTFNASSFNKKIREHIEQNTFFSIEYKFSLMDRKITIYFIGENDVEYKMEKYNEYVKRILVWLYMIHDESSKKCAKTLTLFFYLTSLKKEIPQTELDTLNEIHVNTGFTYTCPENSEIVIYRKEEWFKVFMHESFHNFALDFSEMNNDECKTRILNLFPVKSDVSLYESYTETWASIMNAVFCSYYLLKEGENSFSHFLSNYQYFLHFERTFAVYQMVKVLSFMNLQYKNLYENNNVSNMLRETMYKEDTNVLSYYVIKTILLEHSDEFLSWCQENNYSLMDFKKTNSNIHKYCELIEKYYRSKEFLEDVDTMEKFFKKMKKQAKKEKNPKKMDFFLSNMRMSICELE